MEWQMTHALVTGGGSGIGRAIATRLYQRGARVAVATLYQEELDSLAAELQGGPGELLLIQTDLTADQAVPRLMAELDQAGITVDLLINNAGTGLLGNHVELDPIKVQRALTLNVQVLTELAGAVAQRMIECGQPGQILNVASIGAFVPVPRLAAYSASKHYVLAFSHALAQELAPHDIHVGVLCPGITRTRIYDAMGLVSEQQSEGSISQFIDPFAMSAEQVADSALVAIEKKRRVTLPGFNRAVPLASLLPDRLTSWFMHRLVRDRDLR